MNISSSIAVTWRVLLVLLPMEASFFAHTGTFAQPSATIDAPSYPKEQLREIDALIGKLTLHEQAAQFLLVKSRHTDTIKAAITDYKVGGIATSWNETLHHFVTQHEARIGIPITRGTLHPLSFLAAELSPCQAMATLASLREHALIKAIAKRQIIQWQRQRITRVLDLDSSCHHYKKTENYTLYRQELGTLGMAIHSAEVSTTKDDYFSRIAAGEHILTETVAITHAQLMAQLLSNEKNRRILQQGLRQLLLGKMSKRMHTQSEDTATSISPLQEQFFAKSVVLLKNKEDQLPIRVLDQDILQLSIGNTAGNYFWERVADYKKTDNYSAMIHYPSYSVHLLRLLLEHPAETLILSWRRNSMQPSQAWQASMEKIFSRKKVILVLFGTGSVLRTYPFTQQADAIVYHPTSHPKAEDYTAQCIFGGLRFMAKLPHALPPLYEAGDGIAGSSPTRLSFVVPEAIGIDGNKLHTAVNAIVGEAMQKKAFPGCQILAAKDGKVFFSETYGYHTYAQAVPTKRGDLYDVASLTKATAAMPTLMKLYEEGKFSPDAKLKEYLPAMGKSNKADISFREILSHRAGFVPEIAYRTVVASRRLFFFEIKQLSTSWSGRYPTPIGGGLFARKTLPKTLHMVYYDAPFKEEKNVYSSLGFYFVPHIVENLSGQPYTRYLAENFLQPLGISSCVYNPIESHSKEVIVPTEQDDYFRHTLLHGYVHDEVAALMGGLSGHAGLFASIVDLAKIWQMYLQYGTYGGKHYLEKETIQTFTACQYCAEGNRKALGFDRPLAAPTLSNSTAAISSSAQSFGHSGYTGTLAWADPKNGLLYIFLSNRVHPTRNQKAIYTLHVRPRLHQLFYDAIQASTP